MSLRVTAFQSQTFPLHLRMPFKYGIATMTDVPHLLLRLDVLIDGAPATGFAADNLPPKWFTKNPATSFDEEIAEMRAVIDAACIHAVEAGEAETVFAWWEKVSAAQQATASARGWPPLLAGFGVSLVERAVIDAWCRQRGETFAAAVRANSLGLRLGAIHAELAGADAHTFLPPQPLESVIARHTVGLSDPLTAAEIAPADRVDDGQPQALDECIRACGLTHFKIKLSGRIEHDRDRLHQLAALFRSESPDCRFTLDGNENFREVAPFRALWEELRADAALAPFLRGLIFVEQPLHRDFALSDETAAELLAWPGRPPIIIDESEGDLHALERALAGGYAGTSHKNCKGIFRGLANACLIAHRGGAARGLHLSGEDLTNLGPVALLQDLAVDATLGITHVERNGHHYFRGLSEFPATMQRAVLARHGDLFREHRGYPVVRVEQGRVSTRSLVAAPFGSALSVAELA